MVFLDNIRGNDVVYYDDSKFKKVNGNELSSEVVSFVHNEVLESPSLDFLGPFNVPPEHEFKGESPSSKETRVTKGVECSNSVDKVSNWSMPLVLAWIVEDVKKEIEFLAHRFGKWDLTLGLIEFMHHFGAEEAFLEVSF